MNYIKAERPNPKSRIWGYSLPDSEIRYTFFPSELRSDYKRYFVMDDKEFEENLLKIAHYCCIVGYYKDMDNYDTISDVGIIHEIVHLLTLSKKDDADDWQESFDSVRKSFKKFKL